MIGIFHVLMWYFVLLLYMGQIQGVFGVYKPITYTTGSALWGIVFIISGIFIIKTAKQPSYCVVASALTFSILSLITAIAAIVLTVIELSQFQSVSYRNYGQAKLGRLVSRILLISYHLEVSIAFVYSLITAINLVCGYSLKPKRKVASPSPSWEPYRFHGVTEGRGSGGPAGVCAWMSTRCAPRSRALDYNRDFGTEQG
ncbi:PREDICTED: membrane-spanning 4-domains subfamily A member 13 [Chrysochloris asiatica]|uniref:Membrane-spanning 4-domains subfamily A member 13 n=1 Tax=Chrysochloris asiatica TaxID=185453 RepID=A0A9B0WYS7_CHRAS|nr:PREDICTED: membrane-spanning 4-domains subfamily A member 13 [Chrysochloris asiatica]